MVVEVDGKEEDGPKAKIFISYSRKDMAFADRIEAALKARAFEPLITAPRFMPSRTGGSASNP